MMSEIAYKDQNIVFIWFYRSHRRNSTETLAENRDNVMTFYKPDLGTKPDDPFARDANDKLIRRAYWLDMTDQSLILALTNGIGTALNNEEKRLHLADIGRDHLSDQVCVQELIPPEDKNH